MKTLDVDKFEQDLQKKLNKYTDKWQNAKAAEEFEVSYFYAVSLGTLLEIFKESIVDERV